MDNKQGFREILQYSLTAIYKRNFTVDRFEYKSPAIFEITGYTPEEMLLMPIQDVANLIQPEDLPTVLDIIRKIFAFGGGQIELIYRTIHKNRQIRWVSDLGHIFVDNNGTPLYSIGNNMDDEEATREGLKEMLLELGHTATCSNEGMETFMLYKLSIEQDHPFDNIFLDLTIKGGLGGTETLKKISEINSSARIVVSSRYADHIKSSFLDE
jgi:PAS domain S-box-containing protein